MNATLALGNIKPKNRQVVVLDRIQTSIQTPSCLKALCAACTPARMNLAIAAAAGSVAFVAGILDLSTLLCISAAIAAVCTFIIAPALEKGGAK